MFAGNAWPFGAGIIAQGHGALPMLPMPDSGLSSARMRHGGQEEEDA
jgi:hypothetical protein